MVRAGDVIDEVMNQIKHASTLAQSPCISTMICALQKLRMSDLLFLKQGAEEKYPYLSAIYSGNLILDQAKQRRKTYNLSKCLRSKKISPLQCTLRTGARLSNSNNQ
jgi:SOS-response transcriptional repressor LexA